MVAAGQLSTTRPLAQVTQLRVDLFIAKDLRSFSGRLFPLHLYNLVDAAEASGQGDAEAVEQDLLGLVRLGDAA